MKVLVVFVVCAMFYLAVVMLRERKVRKARGVMTLQVDADSVVDVDKKDDGITVRIRYATFEDRPGDGELFPDIVNEPVRSDYALDEIFWNRLAHIDEMSEQARQELLLKLQEHGFIRSSDISRNIRGAEGKGNSPTTPKGENPADDEDEEYPSMPPDSDFNKAFEY